MEFIKNYLMLAGIYSVIAFFWRTYEMKVYGVLMPSLQDAFICACISLVLFLFFK